MSAHGRRAGTDLALVVGCARSGTTLLRRLLDAHPEIGCPAEAEFPALLSHLARSWLTVHADQLPEFRPQRDPSTAPGGSHLPEPVVAGSPGAGGRPFAQLSERARGWLVDTVSVPMGDYCAEHGKRIYCDKSIDSVHHLPLVRELFPGTRSVLVFRHVMDTIASGLEASPWGLTYYGYRPFVEAASGNTVAALASYWLGHVQQALAWEAAYRDECLRVRYEDLVSDPEHTMADVVGFLGARVDGSILERAFDRTHRGGPGDHKIAHTSAVHAGSVGNGRKVPVNQIPPPLLAEVNRALVRLGYDAMGETWNVGAHGSGGDSAWRDRLVAIMGGARLRPAQDRDHGNVALVADDHPGLRWVIDPAGGAVTRGDGTADRIVAGAAEDLVLMISGEENPGALIRAGRIRHLAPGTAGTDTRRLHRELDWMITGLRGGEPDDTAVPEAGSGSRPSAAWI